MMDWLFKGGTLCTDGLERALDVRLADGKVSQIGDNLAPGPNTVTIDVSGKLLLPGAVELLAEFEEFVVEADADAVMNATGMAALGGVTSLVTPLRPNNGGLLSETVARARASVHPHTFVDFGFHLAISQWTEEARRWVRGMAACGISSVWAQPTGGGARLAGLSGIEEILMGAAHVGGGASPPLLVAPMWDAVAAALRRADTNLTPREDAFGGAGGSGPTREAFPEWVEVQAVRRLAALARAARATILMRSIAGLEALRAYEAERGAGSPILAGATLAHLSAVGGGATPLCWPPQPSPAEAEALWRAVDAALVPIVTGSSGYPAMGGPFPRPADVRHPSETLTLLWPLLYREATLRQGLPFADLAQAVTSDAAKLAGLYPRKGSLMPGSDADLIVFDPTEEWVVGGHGEDGAAPGPFTGQRLRGVVEQVFLRGTLVVERGKQVIVEPGCGRYLERGPVVI